MNLAVFAITKNGIALAKRLSQKIDADLFVSPKNFRGSVRHVFTKYDGLIFIMATGIVVRTIAPFLKNKAEDPAVVVMDEKGKYVISLVSGHLGGANALTRKIAKATGAKPVITTATDVNRLPCIEDIANGFDLVIEDVKKIKAVNSAIVNRMPVAFVDDDAKRLKALRGFVSPRVQGCKFYKSVSQALKNKIDTLVVITNRWQGTISPSPLPRGEGVRGMVILRPKNLVVGIGCDRGIKLKEVESAYFSVLKKWEVSPLSVRNIASIDVKKNETGLLKFAKKYNIKIDFYSKDELADMPLPSGFSEFVMGKVGVGGVCEPAALKSAGTNLSLCDLNRGKIWIKKQKIGRVTIAVAKVPFIS